MTKNAEAAVGDDVPIQLVDHGYDVSYARDGTLKLLVPRRVCRESPDRVRKVLSEAGVSKERIEEVIRRSGE